MKKLHRILSGTVAGMMLAGTLTGGAGAAFATPVKAADKTIILRICNCEEYIDEGDWGEDEVIDLESGDIFSENGLVSDFEEWFEETYGRKVIVEYSCYGTNEELYSQLTLGDVYDLVCPSDYMLMKMMAEGMLTPLSEGFFDESDENNYYIKGVSPYIREIFDTYKINGDPWSDYAAGYMWGTTGMVYNPEYVTEEEASTWNILTNPKFFRQVTVKDSVRDGLFPAVAIMQQELLTDPEFIASEDYADRLFGIMNDTSKETIDTCEAILKDIRANVYSIEVDSGKADMVSGKVLASLQWSGDAVYAMDQAEEDDTVLNWATPIECADLWFDGWVMLKAGISQDPDKQIAAEAFLNFISRPDNVIRNMYYIGYTSCISGGEDDRIYEYLEWNYGADDEEEDVIEYPLGYFFSGDAEDEDYVLTAPAESAKRQLAAQYPTQEVIDRCAIMWYYDNEANARINQMWINIRCFNLSQISAKGWITVVVVLGCIAVAIVAWRLGTRAYVARRAANRTNR